VTVHRQRGSAAVEFVGVGVMVTACALGILQVGVVSHISAVLTDSAIAGAAHAALADSSIAAGIARTQQLASAGIAAGFVDDVSATRTIIAGKPAVTVTVRFRAPTFGPWFPAVTSSVTGRAFAEIT
jgi:Flp pilus assembly protein TadG